MVGHLSQRAIGRDDPAILNYTLNPRHLSRKSYCSRGILSSTHAGCGKGGTGVQDVGMYDLEGEGFFGKMRHVEGCFEA